MRIPRHFILIGGVVLVAVGAVIVIQRLQPSDTGVSTLRYTSHYMNFSLDLPVDYDIDESYRYEGLGGGKDISGIKFTIPRYTAIGTNLSMGTYLSVEKLPDASACTADLFLGQKTKAYEITDSGRTYSVASTTGAAAGNRYDETVYALAGSHPCMAVRYYIHYGVFENFPPNSVARFDEAALLTRFDTIRRSLSFTQQGL